ncbi:MAG: vancomycin high temperature exclusion protein [Bradymonadia bacterium]
MNEPAVNPPETQPPSRMGRVWAALIKIIKISVMLVMLGALAAGGANWWVFHRASEHQYADLDALPSKTVAIVLGAAVYADGTPSPALADRLSMALELYNAGKVQRILVSGDHGKRYYDEVNAMGRWLTERGVNKAHVFQDHAGFRTLDTMIRAKKVFQVKDAIICTQDFHQPRAIFLAHQAGIDAVGAPADKRQYADRHVASVREFMARTLAVLDIYVLSTEPRFLGDPIPISGDPQPSRG